MTDQEIIDVEKQEIKEKPKEKSLIEVDKSGGLKAKTIEEQYKLAKFFVVSGMVPKNFDTPEKVLVGMQFAAELGVKPLTAMKNISVINGTPSIWGDLPLSLVRKSGKLKFIDEYLIDKENKRICIENNNLNEEVFAAVCELQRIGFDKRIFTWTAEQQKKTGKNSDTWSKYYQIMMKRKVRSIGLKDEFGDFLGSVSIAEYDFHTAPDIKDVTPKSDAASGFMNMMEGSEDG